MPSTALLFGLLVIYVIISGRATMAIENIKLLLDSGIFSKEKLASKDPNIKPTNKDNVGDLPEGEGNQA